MTTLKCLHRLSHPLCLSAYLVASALLISCEEDPSVAPPPTDVIEEVDATPEEPRGGILAPPDEPQRTPRCGDGVIDEGEQCDDGGRAAGDGCDPNCIFERCGNGVLQVGEQCDDGDENGEAPNTCRATCRHPQCGDGVTDDLLGEECDDANRDNSDACRANCRKTYCGDGVLRSGVAEGEDGFEECDEGSLNSDLRPNACRLNCQRAWCGDGVVDAEEECDLGRLNSDELDTTSSESLCRTDCKRPRCGDGIADDRPECQEQQLVDVPTPSSCGNGVLDWDEVCDPTAPDNQLPCKDRCEPAICGDGELDERYEECDTGGVMITSCAYGLRSCELCAQGCELRPGAVRYCGDNRVDEPYELCDQGDANGPDGSCDDHCRPADLDCGNRRIDPGEECDDGNSRDHDGCDFQCRSECGNGVLDFGEECDDGELNQLNGRAGCNLACGRFDTLLWEANEEVIVRIPTATAISAFNAEQGRIPSEAQDPLESKHLWINAEPDTTLEVCLYKPFGNPTDLEGALDSELGSGIIDLSVTYEREPSAGEAQNGPQVIEVPALAESSLSSSCRVYQLAERSAYHIQLKGRSDLEDSLSDETRALLVEDRILRRESKELLFKTRISSSRSLGVYERFTGTLESARATLNTPESAEQIVSHQFHARLRDDDRIYLRVSSDGLGDCAEVARSLELNLARADTGLVIDQGRAPTGDLPGACQLIIPSPSTDGAASSVSGPISSGERLEGGLYHITVRRRGHLEPIEYTLDVAIDPADDCGPDDLCPLPPLQQSSWVKSRLHEFRRLPIYPQDEILHGLNSRFDFVVPPRPLAGVDPMTSHLNAHLSGCLDGAEGLLSVWRLDGNGALTRQVHIAKRVNPEEIEAGEAPPTRCQTLSVDLSEGRYALLIEHLTPEEVSPDEPLPLSVHRARSAFPLLVEGDLYREIDGGGRYEGMIRVSEDHSRDDPASGSAALSWGDAAMMLKLSPDQGRRSLQYVTLRVASPSGQCAVANLSYRYQLELESDLLKTPLILSATNLPVGDWTINEQGEASLIRDDAQNADEAILAFSVLNAPASSGCEVIRELRLPATPHRLTLKPILDLSAFPDANALPPELAEGIAYQLEVTLPELCGNGRLDGFESCDDGNLDENDTCSSTCQQQAVCGDGVIEPEFNERCDDGNQDPFDGCSAQCLACGDGIQEGDEECEPSDDPNNLCDDYCTSSIYVESQANFTTNARAIEFGERDTYTLKVGDHTWLSAHTDGCERVDGTRRFDTVMTLNNGSGQELRHNDDRPQSACSEVSYYFEEADRSAQLIIESYRGNDILGYQLSVAQEVRLLFDEAGLCVQTPQDLDQLDLKPITRCANSSTLIVPPEPDQAPNLLKINASLVGKDQRKFKLQVGRTVSLGVELWRKTDADICPDIMTVEGLTDELGNAQRFDFQEPQAGDDPLSCGKLVDANLESYIWPNRFYVLNFERSQVGSQSNYELRLSVNAPKCGNGYHEIGEECDLGEEINSDDQPGATSADLYGRIEVCRTTCRLPHCGDGVQDFREACDLGAQNTDEDYQEGVSLEGVPCRSDCTIGYCGDGILDFGEECDHGLEGANPNALNGACLTSCVEATCGDGNLWAGEEVCDDGNNVDGDGCSADCSDRETLCGDGRFIPSTEECPPDEVINAACGDGTLVNGLDPRDPRYEECDDGNLSDGDGCNALCRHERRVLVSEVSRLNSHDLHLYQLTVDGPGKLTVFTQGAPDQRNPNTCEQSDTVLAVYLMNQDTNRKSSLLGLNDDLSNSSQCSRVDLNIYRAGTYLIEVTPYENAPRTPYELTTIFTRDLSGGGSLSGRVSGQEYDVFLVTLQELKQLDITASSPQYQSLYVQFHDSLEAVYTAASNFGDGVPLPMLGLSHSLKLEGQEYDEVYVMVRSLTGDRSIDYQLNVSPICGDQVIDKQGEGSQLYGEECDDGGRASGDGCSMWCKVELNQCGNAIFEIQYPGDAVSDELREECDDGHLINDPETLLHLQSSNLYKVSEVIPRPLGDSPDIISRDSHDYSGNTNEVAIIEITQGGLPGAARYRYYYQSEPEIDLRSDALFSLGAITLPDDVKLTVSETLVPLAVGQKWSVHLFPPAFHKQVMTKSYRVFFEIQDSEQLNTVKLLIDPSALSEHRSAVPSDSNVAPSFAILDYNYPTDFSIVDGEADLTNVAADIESKLAPFVRAYARSNELSIIARAGNLSEPLVIGTESTPSPWQISAGQPICDQMCTYRIRRLVSSEKSTKSDDHLMISGKIPEGDQDQYYFHLNGRSTLDAYTSGCTNLADNPIDTEMTLYRVEHGAPTTILAENDDLQTLLEAQPDLMGTLGLNNEEIFCSYLKTELPAGDYLLEVRGHIRSLIPRYQLNFNLQRQTEVYRGSLPTTSLDALKRDEFSEQWSRESYRVSYYDLSSVTPYGRVCKCSGDYECPDPLPDQGDPPANPQIDFDVRECISSLQPSLCDLVCVTEAFNPDGGVTEALNPDGEISIFEGRDNTSDEYLKIKPEDLITFFQGDVNLKENGELSYSAPQSLTDDSIPYELSYSLTIQPDVALSNRWLNELAQARLELPFSYQHCPNSTGCDNLCGNGILDDPYVINGVTITEECDDGDDLDDNQCTNKCRINSYDLSVRALNTVYGVLDLNQATPLNLGDDNTQTINLGAPFKYYNREYHSLTYSSNGFILLREDVVDPSPTPTSFRDNGCCSGGDLRGGRPLIAGYWEDLLGGYGARSGRNRFLSTVVNDQSLMILEWEDILHYPYQIASTFRIILNLTNHTVLLQCENCQSDGGNHTQGLQSHLPNYFHALSDRIALPWDRRLGSGDEVLFTPTFDP